MNEFLKFVKCESLKSSEVGRLKMPVSSLNTNLFRNHNECYELA